MKLREFWPGCGALIWRRPPDLQACLCHGKTMPLRRTIKSRQGFCHCIAKRTQAAYQHEAGGSCYLPFLQFQSSVRFCLRRSSSAFWLHIWQPASCQKPACKDRLAWCAWCPCNQFRKLDDAVRWEIIFTLPEFYSSGCVLQIVRCYIVLQAWAYVEIIWYWVGFQLRPTPEHTSLSVKVFK